MLNFIPEEAERGEWVAADVRERRIHQVCGQCDFESIPLHGSSQGMQA